MPTKPWVYKSVNLNKLWKGQIELHGNALQLSCCLGTSDHDLKYEKDGKP
jgi:hypothetical protein